MPNVSLADLLAARPVRITAAPRFYRCELSWAWSPPPLPDFDLWYVLDGQGEIAVNEERHAIEPHTCFLLRPTSTISASQKPERRLRVFAVHFDLLTRNSLSLPPLVQRIDQETFFGVLARQCEAAWRSGDQPRATSLLAEMLLYLCAAPQLPPRLPTDRRVDSLLEEAREEPGRFWSVSALARRAGLSRAQFARKVMQATGHPPEQFLIQARIDRARQLLRETDLTTSQIADALGYRDIYYFSRQFAKVTGSTASAFRRGR